MGKSQYGLVRYRLSGFACFVDGQHVIPQPSEFLDDRQREILVSV